MRYAIVSDIHANYPAWEIVLADISALGAEMIICLGDMVGYGPQPAETLSSVHANVDYFVLGNHDAALCGLLDTEAFNDDAAEMIEWTRKQVDVKAIDFLREQPLIVHGDDFLCVHGTANEPSTFAYVLDEEDARTCLNATEVPLVFVGHTHSAGIHYLNRDDQFRQVDAMDFELEEGKRYVVNPGSVGMARGDDFRASYCIYDSDARSIAFRQVAYDVNALREAATCKAAECEQLNYVLELFDENRRTPVRKQIDFSPTVAHEGEYASDQQIHVGVRLWRRAFIAAMLLVAVLGVGSWVLWTQEAPPPLIKPLVIGAVNDHPFDLSAMPGNTLELIRKDSPAAENKPLANLSARLTRPDASSVRKVAYDRILMTNSVDDGEIILKSPQLTIGGLSKFQIFVLMEAETGVPPSVFVDHVNSDGSITEGVDFKSAVRLKDGDYRIQRTVRPFPKDAKAGVLRLKWAGTGKVIVKQFTVRVKK